MAITDGKPASIYSIEFVSSLLFALHPIHSEVVNWYLNLMRNTYNIWFLKVCSIVGRAEILMSIFFLLAALKFLDVLDEKKPFDILKMATFSSLSMLSKEQGIMIFVRFLFYSPQTKFFQPICILLDSTLLRICSGKFISKEFLRRCLLLSAAFGCLLSLRMWVNNFTTPTFRQDENPIPFLRSPFLKVIQFPKLELLSSRILVFKLDSHLDTQSWTAHESIENVFWLQFRVHSSDWVVERFASDKTDSNRRNNCIISKEFKKVGELETVGFLIEKLI